MGDYNEALAWYSAALQQDEANFHYLSRLIRASVAGNQPAYGLQLVERALEVMLRLDKDTWHTTLLNSADAKPEDLQWLLDEKKEVCVCVCVLCLCCVLCVCVCMCCVLCVVCVCCVLCFV